MDRTIDRFVGTGRSIPDDLQHDDTGPVVHPEAQGWERVRQMRGESVRAPRQPQQPGGVPGRAPSSLALRQLLATGSSAPPSARAGEGRSAALPRQRPEGPEPEGDYGRWARPGRQEPPVGYEAAMGQEPG
jgi:hypothetical protein